MDQRIGRTGIALLIVAALLVGAALPAVGGAAKRALIGTAQLRDGAVTNAKVRKGSLRYGAFKAGEVAPATLAGIRAGGALAGTYPKPGIARGAVTADAIATGAVGSAEIGAGAVRAVDIANGSIGASKIAPNSIGKEQLAPGGVGASEIAPGAVGVSELAPLPGARAFALSATQIPSGDPVVVPLTGTDYVNGGVWRQQAPQLLTAPVDGVYSVTASALFAANTGGIRAVYVVRNGDAGQVVTGEQQLAINVVGAQNEVSAATILHLDAGQSVALAVQQTSGGPLNVLPERTALSLQFMSR